MPLNCIRNKEIFICVFKLHLKMLSAFFEKLQRLIKMNRTNKLEQFKQSHSPKKVNEKANILDRRLGNSQKTR